MLLLDLISRDDAEAKPGPNKQTIKLLHEQSAQLQEYSRLLRERSREINRRIQAHLHLKRAS